MANLIVEIIQSQPDLDEVFYTTFDWKNEEIVTSLSDDRILNMVSRVNKTAPPRTIFMAIGQPATFLAKYSIVSGKPKFLKHAKNLLLWLSTVDESMYSSPLSNKNMFAAALVGTLTGDNIILEMAYRIADFLLDSQNGDGTFSGMPTGQGWESSMLLRQVDAIFRHD